MATDTRKQLRINEEVLAPWQAIAERERRSLTKMTEVVLERALPSWQERETEPKAVA